jgi:nicotinamide mononucleotide transporter
MNSLIRYNVQAVLLALALTLSSYFFGRAMDWFKPGSVTVVEWLAVFTSYASTYLCVVQSRTNYYWGAISVLLYSYLFYSTALLSSAILSVYLLPVLVWGWFRWRPDEITRPVEFVEFKWWPAYLGFAAVVWFFLTRIVSSLGAELPGPDSLILVLSVLAQALLDQKKLETWAVWFVVNVIAIYTYSTSGLYLVTFQYAVFLLNTLWASYEWWRTLQTHEQQT